MDIKLQAALSRLFHTTGFLGVIFERCLNLLKNVCHIQKQERFLQQHLQHIIYYHG